MDAKAIKTLVVDDDAFVREVISSLLEADGYQVLTAENGLQALEQCCTTTDIELIISDVNMPEMDGITLLKSLQEQQLDIPVVMVTSVGDISVAVDALNNGATEYILKDEGIQDTIGITARQAIEKHRLKQHNAQLLEELATRTKQQEETLSYLTAILNNMPDGLLVANNQACITIANPAIQEMFELPEGNLTGKTCFELFHDKIPDMGSSCDDTGSNRITRTIQLSGNRVGSAVFAPICGTSEQDQPFGNLMIVRDVTREREIDRMKDDFISIVSHELRTPLTSILGFSKIIRKKLNETILPQLSMGNPRTKRSIERILQSFDVIDAEGSRLTILINDLLDLSRLESGKALWKPEQVKITELVERAIATTASLFEEKGLELGSEVPEGLPLVTGDRDRLLQVLINLLSNACKFTDSGSVSLKVKLPDNDNGQIRVEITDTGSGIAEEDLHNVFEKFSQVGSVLTDRPTGTGLGLSICRQIVEHHGGSISATSQPGVGSCFYFTLPVNGPCGE